MRTVFPAVFVAAVLLAGFLFWDANANNVQCPAGYACYVYEKPMLGSTRFVDVINGPSSTGLSWRLFGDLVSVTPYSYSEDFSGTSALIAKDKLAMTGNGHIVWRIKSAKPDVRNYMEEFGGLEPQASADESAKASYDNYIKQPFGSLIREEFAAYNGLDIPDHIAEMGQHIEAELSRKLQNTPFEVIQVVIGNAQPPPVVLEQIALKVAKTQEFERKVTEQAIADANRAIEKANGEASGARDLAIATQQAQANELLSKSLTPALLQYAAIQNMKTADKIYIPVGNGGIPIVATLPDEPAKK